MSSTNAPRKVSSEDVIGQKTDLCISNTIVKTGIGFSAGVVLSVLLFKRRAWPVWLGTGFGMGSGYTDCERMFNPVAVPGVRIVPAKSVEGAASSSPGTFELLQQKAGEAFGAAKVKAGDQLEQATEKASSELQRGKELAKDSANDLLSRAKSGANKLEDKVRQV
ncbi:DUF543-domain-containing protein [Tilletiaria anomala UBC 951]|uniref:MICOS complex subunit MIC10 n=1 Tax=Tilletiaria anomala (strain ATCC 24038 / CBS 436.72 / UBC 951) TaxID=1037660 RepID=A0A066WBM7_TILAU|nr:DUF543-domain-containing protein [Tilletiaria anomala UBC 951]KDN49933.1 DUF543-domain-containing protein [Tilletiaria anomala UBC 951]